MRRSTWKIIVGTFDGLCAVIFFLMSAFCLVKGALQTIGVVDMELGGEWLLWFGACYALGLSAGRAADDCIEELEEAADLRDVDL